mmetsp:Transcript_5264/g.15033  ORF Transcript_5264/g.15033 Transcript_5264/m.15033 type:complete len:315 (-) Transcript_5264:328-1272(-)
MRTWSRSQPCSISRPSSRVPSATVLREAWPSPAVTTTTPSRSEQPPSAIFTAIGRSGPMKNVTVCSKRNVLAPSANPTAGCGDVSITGPPQSNASVKRTWLRGPTVVPLRFKPESMARSCSDTTKCSVGDSVRGWPWNHSSPKSLTTSRSFITPRSDVCDFRPVIVPTNTWLPEESLSFSCERPESCELTSSAPTALSTPLEPSLRRGELESSSPLVSSPVSSSRPLLVSPSVICQRLRALHPAEATLDRLRVPKLEFWSLSEARETWPVEANPYGSLVSPTITRSAEPTVALIPDAPVLKEVLWSAVSPSLPE